MKHWLFLGIALLLGILTLGWIRRRQKIAEDEQRQNSIIANVAAIANAFRIPPLATTGQQPLQSYNVNPVNGDTSVYDMQPALSFPRDTGSIHGSVDGAQQTGIIGGLLSWLHG